MKNVVIAGYCRSSFTPAHKGRLAAVRADDLAARVVQGLIDRTGITHEEVEDLILGCGFPEGEQGLNLARLLVHLTALPISVAGTTVNRLCGSSMQAIHMAAGAIQMGAGEVFICAGVESMSRIPMGGFNPMPNPTLYGSYPQAYISMGETAENLARKYGIGRTEQENFALASHQKALAAQQKGLFAEEIVPIESPEAGIIDTDGCIRPDTSLDALAKLPPAFLENGSVTAGTLLSADGWRGGGAGLQRGLRGCTSPQKTGAHQGHRGFRLRPRDHGHRSGQGHPQGLAARRPDSGGHRHRGVE